MDIVIGLTALGTLYLSGTIPLWIAGYGLLFLFPVYLVVIATVLSVWLG